MERAFSARPVWMETFTVTLGSRRRAGLSTVHSTSPTLRMPAILISDGSRSTVPFQCCPGKASQPISTG
jgi:hypothetical protein